MVNIENGRWYGYNTDVNGFAKALEPAMNNKINNALILGAGGAARSVVYALVTRYSINDIAIVNRSEQRASRFSDWFHSVFRQKLMVNPKSMDYDLVVNATSVGTQSDISPVSESFFNKQKAAFDLVYKPHETVFLTMAKLRGISIIHGIDMLVFQAAEAFRLWTDTEMPVDRIFSVLRNEPDFR